MSSVWQDVRFGFRMMMKKPGVTFIAVLALALGIGANTAIFSVVNTVLLRPLPYRDAGRIMLVFWSAPKLTTDDLPASAPDFLDWREQNRVFERVAAITGESFNLTGEGAEPERIESAAVSADLFPLLGVNTARGRAFTAEEEQEGRNKVVVMGHDLWQRRFGSNPNLVGQTITLNNEAYTVLGIMPQDFRFPEGTDRIDLWVPLSFSPEVLAARGHRYLYVAARLKEGVTLEQAASDMNGLSKRMAEANPGTNTDWSIKLEPLQDALTEDVSTALFVLLGAVGFVLLIACANVANLQLARAAARRREVAIRLAVGASRRRLIRQFLIESSVLSLTGGLFGLLMAFWGIDALRSVLPQDVPRLEQIGIDRAVLLFTLSVSVATGILLGLVPALQATKPDMVEALKDGAQSVAGGHRRNRVRSLLVVLEVALALVLLIGAGLMMKSFWRLREVRPGFDPNNVLTMQLALPETKYEEPQTQAAFYQSLVERVQSVPGVKSAGVTTSPPLLDDSRTDLTIEGQEPLAYGDEQTASYGSVSPGYFSAMGIPIVKGRAFTDEDREGSVPVLIVSSAFANRFFPGQDAIGKRLKQGGPEDEDSPWMTIVGVAGDVHHYGLNAEVSSEMYIPIAQKPQAETTLAVRTSAANPMSLLPAVRREVEAIDKDQPIYNVKTVEHLLSDSVASERLSVTLLGLFAGLAFLLACVGIYGVISYSVTQRTHEIGVRIALGASQRDILKLVVGQGMKMVVLGLVLGLIASFALTRVMASLLFKVSATDPATFLLVSLLLAVVAFLASFIPARRATRVDPMVALRYE
ncbi:MAG TPA: ABC transporter permease [Pyrinomonadaceae bacterium]|nr:ABC transporter permease [Pyrinomonadaceae bacterium]